MLVRLSTRQWGHVLASYPLAEHFTVEQIETHARVAVYAPYAAWEAARLAMMDRVFSPRGYRRSGIPSAAAAALKAIARAVGTVSRHPALRGAGMFGLHSDWFPVWRLPEEDHWGRIWSPHPVDGAPFAVLYPKWRDGGQLTTTTWGPGGLVPPASRLHDLHLEETHHRFWTEAVAVAVRDEQLRR